MGDPHGINKAIRLLLVVAGIVLIFMGIVGELLMVFAATVVEPKLRMGVLVGAVLYLAVLFAGVGLLRIKTSSMPEGAAWQPFLLKAVKVAVGWYLMFLGGIFVLCGIGALPNFGALVLGVALGGVIIWGGWTLAHKR